MDCLGDLIQRHPCRYHHHGFTDQGVSVFSQEVYADDFLCGFIRHQLDHAMGLAADHCFGVDAHRHFGFDCINAFGLRQGKTDETGSGGVILWVSGSKRPNQAVIDRRARYLIS